MDSYCVYCGRFIKPEEESQRGLHARCVDAKYLADLRIRDELSQLSVEWVAGKSITAHEKEILELVLAFVNYDLAEASSILGLENGRIRDKIAEHGLLS